MKFTQFSLRSMFALFLLAALAFHFGRPLGERELKAKLKTPTTAKWSNKPLQQVLDELAAEHGIRIEVDSQGLAEEGVTGDTPVSVDLNQKVMLKSVLNLVLEPLGLMWQVRTERWHGQYVVVTSDRLRQDLLTTASIDVEELAATPEEYAKLSQQVRENIYPASWEKGGKGKIDWSINRRHLQVTQTQSVMEQVIDFVEQLKRVKAVVRARNYLKDLAVDDRHTPGAWCALAVAREGAPNRALSISLARRADKIVRDPEQLREKGEACCCLMSSTHYYELHGAIQEASYEIELRETGWARLRRPGLPDVHLGLSDAATIELRRLCAEALSGSGRISE